MYIVHCCTVLKYTANWAGGQAFCFGGRKGGDVGKYDHIVNMYVLLESLR